MNQYDYFLFDWDGCLAKTVESWIDAYKQAFAGRGLTPTNAEINRYMGDWKIGTYFGIKDYENFNQEAVKAAQNKLLEIELYEGAKTLLAQLVGNKKIGIVSNGSRDIITKGLHYNEIYDIFSVIVSGDDVVNQKPSPEPLIKAFEALGGAKEKYIMIGDSGNDINAAKAFGIDSVLISRASHDDIYDDDYLKSLNPTYVINHFDDLVKTLSVL